MWFSRFSLHRKNGSEKLEMVAVGNRLDQCYFVTSCYGDNIYPVDNLPDILYYQQKKDNLWVYL